MISLLITLAGLVLALLFTGFAMQEIRDRDHIGLVSFFCGVTATGIFSFWSLLAWLPAIILGLAVWGVVYLASCQTFEPGEARIYQPVFFRAPGSAIDSREWLVVMPGFQPFWDGICVHLASVQVGRLVIEEDADILFPEGLGIIRFRIDAELPTARPDLLGRFVHSVPVGTRLTDVAARSKYIQERITALAKKMLEGVAEKVSAFTADAPQLQAMADGTSPIGPNLIHQLKDKIEEVVGLPATDLKFEIIDMKLGAALQTNLAERSTNDSIRQKAVTLLEAYGMPDTKKYRPVLRQKQQRLLTELKVPDAATVATKKKEIVEKMNAQGKARRAKLSVLFGAMLVPDKDPKKTGGSYEERLAADKKTPAAKLTEMLADYKRRYAEAKLELEQAMAEAMDTEPRGIYADEFRTYEAANKALAERKKKLEAAESLNSAAPDPANPDPIHLAPELEEEYREYQDRYTTFLQDAVSSTAAGGDTSRISIKGLEGLGGANGLEALRVLGSASKKGGGV